jgi:hypothetical protein
MIDHLYNVQWRVYIFPPGNNKTSSIDLAEPWLASLSKREWGTD